MDTTSPEFFSICTTSDAPVSTIKLAPVLLLVTPKAADAAPVSSTNEAIATRKNTIF